MFVTLWVVSALVYQGLPMTSKEPAITALTESSLTKLVGSVKVPYLNQLFTFILCLRNPKPVNVVKVIIP